MQKIKFALLKYTYELPELKDLKKQLGNVKKIAKIGHKTTTASWVDCKNVESFSITVHSAPSQLFGEAGHIYATLYAFSDDANSTMLAMFYPNQIVSFFRADEKDIEQYLSDSWSYDTLMRFAKCYDLDGHIDFVIEKLPLTKSAIAKLNSQKKCNAKNIEFIKSLATQYELRMKKIITTGWD